MNITITISITITITITIIIITTIAIQIFKFTIVAEIQSDNKITQPSKHMFHPRIINAQKYTKQIFKQRKAVRKHKKMRTHDHPIIIIIIIDYSFSQVVDIVIFVMITIILYIIYYHLLQSSNMSIAKTIRITTNITTTNQICMFTIDVVHIISNDANILNHVRIAIIHNRHTNLDYHNNCIKITNDANTHRIINNFFKVQTCPSQRQSASQQTSPPPFKSSCSQ